MASGRAVREAHSADPQPRGRGRGSGGRSAVPIRQGCGWIGQGTCPAADSGPAGASTGAADGCSLSLSEISRHVSSGEDWKNKRSFSCNLPGVGAGLTDGQPAGRPDTGCGSRRSDPLPGSGPPRTSQAQGPWRICKATAWGARVRVGEAWLVPTSTLGAFGVRSLDWSLLGLGAEWQAAAGGLLLGTPPGPLTVFPPPLPRDPSDVVPGTALLLGGQGEQGCARWAETPTRAWCSLGSDLSRGLSLHLAGTPSSLHSPPRPPGPEPSLCPLSPPPGPLLPHLLVGPGVPRNPCGLRSSSSPHHFSPTHTQFPEDGQVTLPSGLWGGKVSLAQRGGHRKCLWARHPGVSTGNAERFRECWGSVAPGSPAGAGGPVERALKEAPVDAVQEKQEGRVGSGGGA